MDLTPVMMHFDSSHWQAMCMGKRHYSIIRTMLVKGAVCHFCANSAIKQRKQWLVLNRFYITSIMQFVRISGNFRWSATGTAPHVSFPFLSLTFSSWWADGWGDWTKRSFVLFFCPYCKSINRLQVWRWVLVKCDPIYHIVGRSCRMRMLTE